MNCYGVEDFMEFLCCDKRASNLKSLTRQLNILSKI